MIFFFQETIRALEIEIESGEPENRRQMLSHLLAEGERLTAENARLLRVAEMCGADADRWALKWRELAQARPAETTEP